MQIDSVGTQSAMVRTLVMGMLAMIGIWRVAIALLLLAKSVPSCNQVPEAKTKA